MVYKNKFDSDLVWIAFAKPNMSQKYIYVNPFQWKIIVNKLILINVDILVVNLGLGISFYFAVLDTFTGAFLTYSIYFNYIFCTLILLNNAK